MASNWRRAPIMKPPYSVPPKWEKGEPLAVERLNETCYRLYRSGSYLSLPGAPLTHEVEYLEFGSRLEMVEFQQWWDLAIYSPRYRNAPHFWLSYGEFVEVLEEMFSLNLREILGNRQGTNQVPEFTMSIQVKDDGTAERLRVAHNAYVGQVRAILGVQEGE